MRLSSLLWFGGVAAAVAVGHSAPYLHDIIIADVGLVSLGVGYMLGATGQQARTVEPVTQARSIPNLGDAPNGFEPIRDLNVSEYATVGSSDLRENVKQSIRDGKQDRKLDPRILTWARGVTYDNIPMTQARWCGKGKTFSKTAYVAWIADLIKNRIIIPENLKSDRSTYTPNGGAGRAYIKALADERVYYPFPDVEVSETSTAFLREQMRRREAEGEGR